MRDREYALVRVESETQWGHYHTIRSQILFGDDYDPDCPDDRAVNNHPLLFLVNGRAVGAMRVDLVRAAGYAIMRTVAIRNKDQRQGYGPVMLAMAEAHAQDHGYEVAVTIADNDAVPFYEKCGYSAYDWEINQLDAHGTQMRRALAREKIHR